MIGFNLFFILVMALIAYPVLAFFAAGWIPGWDPPKAVGWILAGAVLLGILCTAFRLLALAMLHLAAFLLVCKGIDWILCRFWRPAWLKKVYRSGAVALALTLLFMAYGYYNMNHVQKTTYEISSEKLSRDYRVVFLSDIHYGAVQNRDILEEKVREINALQPDVVILGGDLLDETATAEEMRACFTALGQLTSTYGTYYIYGNHDRQRYSQSPLYTEEQLQQTVDAAGITVLQESTVLLGQDLQLLGREDLGSREEATGGDTLKEQLQSQRFLIVADHQPFGAEENAGLGADLQISGHTHGGQIFPLGLFSFLFQGYIYGAYQVENMTLLVSSGFAGWGFPVRTQYSCEYVVVELLAA